MTDPLEAARAFVAAGDALNSQEHAADVEKLREISQRVHAREQAYADAHTALINCHCKQVETGEAEPAPNLEAEAVIENRDFTRYFNGNHPTLSQDEDEFATPRANGALTDEDFTPPAQAD